MIFVLIFTTLTLAVITGFQFVYLAYLGKIELEHKNYIRDLERTCKTLRSKLAEAEAKIGNNKSTFVDEEQWAELIVEK